MKQLSLYSDKWIAILMKQLPVYSDNLGAILVNQVSHMLIGEEQSLWNNLECPDVWGAIIMKTASSLLIIEELPMCW